MKISASRSRTTVLLSRNSKGASESDPNIKVTRSILTNQDDVYLQVQKIIHDAS